MSPLVLPLLIAFAQAPVPLHASPRPAVVHQEDDTSRFGALLAALDPAVEEDDAVDRLAALGVDLARQVLDWHRADADGVQRISFDEDGWRRIERAAERIDRGALQATIRTRTEGEDPPAVAAAALHLLRRAGSADQADLLVELLGELDVARPGRGDDSALALSTLHEIQRRDKRLSGALGARIDALSTTWIGLIAHELAQVGSDADDLAFVWRGLEMRTAEAALLSALVLVADTCVYRVDDDQLHLLRRRILSPDLDIAEPAILAASRLGDDRIIEQLIAFLTQTEPRIRAAAAHGLKTLTDLPFEDDVELWERWFERSTAWWDEHGATLAEDLQWADDERATELILQIARQRLHRAELVEALIGTFERNEGPVVDLAVLCLRELHWHGTPRRLVDVLETHSSARVKGVACRALRSLTGLDAGFEAASWRLALLL